MNWKKCLLLPLLLLLVSPVWGFEWRLGDSTNALVIPAESRFESEALVAAYQLDVQADAERDLWLLSAGAANQSGSVAGDLRAFASSSTIAGAVQGNLFAYAKGMHLTSNAVVQGEAMLFGTDLICEGAVTGNARIVAKSLTLGGTWGGDVRVDATEIRVSPGTQIAGNLTYSSSKPLVLDSSVTVGGQVAPAPIVSLPTESRQTRFALHGYLFLAALLVGMPWVGFCPLTAGSAVRQLRTAPFKSLLAGLAALFGGPFVAAFVFSTIVGIPLGLILSALLAVVFYLSHIVIALGIGHTVLRASGEQTMARVLSALATGLFILYFLSALPSVTAFLVLPVLLLGSGALLRAIFVRPVFAIPLPPPLSNESEPPVSSN